MQIKKKLSILSAVILLNPFNVSAAIYSNGSKTTSFDVTLKIVADCTINVSPLDFGQSQGLLTSTISVTTNMNVLCTNTTPYNIGLNAGTGVGSTGVNRFMSGTGANTNTVQFNLYQDASKTQWGDNQGVNTKGGVGSGLSQNITVYGEIPVQKSVDPDSYKSTITATVYF